MDGMDAQDLEGSRRRPSDAVTPLGCVCVWRHRRSPLSQPRACESLSSGQTKVTAQLHNNTSATFDRDPLISCMTAAICLG